MSSTQYQQVNQFNNLTNNFIKTQTFSKQVFEV